MHPRNFFAELKRRNVYKVVAAYAVVAWLLIQAASIILPTFEAPAWTMKVLIAALALGFPVATVLAWVFELTPEGFVRSDEVAPHESITRRTGRKLDFLIIGVLMIVITLLITDRLRRSAVAGSPIGKSIAVLPFENFGQDPGNAFFADGIQDDILTSLAKIAGLKVISRTSVMQYRGAGALRNLREIASALGVENVLQGSVRRIENRVLINVQLIDARNDRHIWAERYDRTLTDTLTLQGEVAAEIAAALRTTLSPEEKARLDTKPTLNPEAYLLYLRAREREGNVESTEKDYVAAEQLYAQAIALDAAFALAHARASITNTFLYLQSNEQPRRLKARAEAEAAVRLSPTLGEAHLALGLWLYMGEKDYEAALKEFGIAEKTSPNNAEISRFSGAIFRRQGRWHHALAHFQRAQDLDPRVPHDEVAVTQMALRNWPAAAEAFRRLRQVAPESVGYNAYCQISLAYVEFSRTGGLAASKEILRTIPTALDPEGNVARARWDFSMLERDFVAAEKILAEFPSGEFSPSMWHPKSYYQACAALARGEHELARGLFEEARVRFETEVRNHPEEPMRRAQLGLINAYMGRKEDALREAHRAVDLEPETKNAFHGAMITNDLALVYARTGEVDRAITLIERLLSTPGAGTGLTSITLADLRLRWCWDPLRNDPRFQKLLEGPEPKTIY
jgi:TolB-like protein